MGKQGQYFIILNVDQREFLHPHKLGMGLKLREICTNRGVAVIAYLLRQSDIVGGGDISSMQKFPNAGRWAGNRVIVVGEGDKSGLYQKAMHSIPNGERYTDISMVIRREFEKFVEEPLDERWDR